MSPYISLYLVISPHISAYLPQHELCRVMRYRKFEAEASVCARTLTLTPKPEPLTPTP